MEPVPSESLTFNKGKNCAGYTYHCNRDTKFYKTGTDPTLHDSRYISRQVGQESLSSFLLHSVC